MYYAKKDTFIIGTPPRFDSAFMSTESISQRIGLNSGNLAYVHAIDKHLGGVEKIIDIGDLPTIINSAGKVGVIPAANQLGAHFNETVLTERFSELTVELVMIGLGAQSDVNWTIPDVPESTLTWLRHIIERAPGNDSNIAVRGQFTLDVLDRHGLAGHAVVLGCPSLFINPNPYLGREIASNLQNPSRIAVVAGHESWQHLGSIEASLSKVVTETRGSYIGQHGLTMMKITRGEANDLSEDTLRLCRDYVYPELELDEFVRWCRVHGHVFFDISSWIEHMRRFDFVVGSRIHGTLIGLQAGVPSLCIVHDSRTLELCQTMKVPHVLAASLGSSMTKAQLLSRFKFDADEFDCNRRALARKYIAFLRLNRLKPVQWLVDLGGES